MDVNKKNRRSLSTNDQCRSVLTDIAVRCCEGTSSSHLDVQRFQTGYLCRPCFREVERLSLQEKQVQDLRGAIENKLRQRIHRYVTIHGDSESRPANPSSSRRLSRKRPASTVASVSDKSPDVAVSFLK